MTSATDSPLYALSATTIDGRELGLDTYRGQVLLIVNVASKCGYTSQYRQLEALYRRYQSQGFVVLGFPCNQFGGQEPGSDSEIQQFCSLTYDVTFPMFARIDVNGVGAHPLYQWLKRQKRGLLGSSIKWNFTKFLVGRDGAVIARYGSTESPDAIEPAVKAALVSP